MGSFVRDATAQSITIIQRWGRVYDDQRMGEKRWIRIDDPGDGVVEVYWTNGNASDEQNKVKGIGHDVESALAMLQRLVKAGCK
jgi:hypothetical protein